MQRFRVGLFLTAVCALLVGSASTTALRESPASKKDPDGRLSRATKKELARALEATEKYHEVEEALEDGYVNFGYRPGEGFEYVNERLVDCTFDPEQPEVLHYVLSRHGRLRLVGVEYAVPIECSDTAPEGFTGDADEWEFMAEGLPFWALNAWLWLPNRNGIFAEPPHPQIR
jgi:hypothetical protein